MTKFFLIPPLTLSAIKKGERRSKGSMKAYGVDGLETKYIGSEITDGGRVYDYWIDEQGRYWYETRMRLPNGQIVSMEKYLFGTENIRKKHRQ